MSAFIQKHTTPFPSLIDMRVSGLLCNGEISHEECSFLNQNLLSISKCIILSWEGGFFFSLQSLRKDKKTLPRRYTAQNRVIVRFVSVLSIHESLKLLFDRFSAILFTYHS